MNGEFIIMRGIDAIPTLLDQADHDHSIGVILATVQTPGRELVYLILEEGKAGLAIGGNGACVPRAA